MIELIGLQKVADLLVSIGTIDLALLIAYVVGRYSGNYPGFVSMIDYISEEIWVFVSYFQSIEFTKFITS